MTYAATLSHQWIGKARKPSCSNRYRERAAADRSGHSNWAIVNELVTNAVKYAFPGESSGTVTVVLKREPGELRLTVADDTVRESIPDVPTPGSAAAWSRASPNSSVAKSSGRAAARVRPCA
jgi:hypothetical protein